MVGRGEGIDGGGEDSGGDDEEEEKGEDSDGDSDDDKKYDTIVETPTRVIYINIIVILVSVS